MYFSFFSITHYKLYWNIFPPYLLSFLSNFLSIPEKSSNFLTSFNASLIKLIFSLTFHSYPCFYTLSIEYFSYHFIIYYITPILIFQLFFFLRFLKTFLTNFFLNNHHHKTIQLSHTLHSHIYCLISKIWKFFLW